MTAPAAVPRYPFAQQTLAEFTLERWPHLVVAPLLFIVVFALAVAALGRIWRRPLDTLTAQLDAIAAGEVDRRITVPASGLPAHPLGISLAAALDRLVGALRANERLLADAAHELRSPFTIVRGVLELEALDRDRPALRNAIGEVDRANRVLDDLLLLARTTSQGANLQTVDADDVVNAEIRRLRRTHPDVTVERNVAPVQIEAIGDSIDRMVWNLLDNAAKYGRGQVRVTLEQLKNQLLLWVDDNGTTVPHTDRSRMRQRFQRADDDPADRVNGVGLGLAIVDELVGLYGGTFRLSASPLGGCQAMVALPLEREGTGRDASGRRAGLRRLSAWLGRHLPAMTALAFTALLVVAAEATVLATYWSVGSHRSAEAAPVAPEPGIPVATASSGSDPGDALDGDPTSSWSSGVDQEAGMWFQVDLGRVMEVSRVELIGADTGADFPRSFRLDLADDEASLGREGLEPVMTGRGAEGSTVIELEPRRARVVRVSLLPGGGDVPRPWSISELVIVAS